MTLSSWLPWALLSALFAALTAIFAKVGIEAIALFLVLSALATGASWICYFRALKLGDASKVAPVDKLSVVLVAVFATAFLGERPGLREWLGIALVGGGVLLLSLRGGP
jgi:transporter family protein